MPDQSSVRSWCGSYSLGDAKLFVSPESDSFAREYLESTADSKRIQILGSRYSWKALVDAHGGSSLSCEALNKVCSLANEGIRVQAGAKLSTIHTFLETVGLRLVSAPPVIASQTIAGAIATGTHGQGLGQSTLGDALVSMTILDSRGKASEIDRGSPEFGAFQLHLGCLGFVTHATLETCSNDVYTCEKRVIAVTELLKEFERFNRAYEFCKIWWFPLDDCAHLWLARKASAQEEQAFVANGKNLLAWGNRRSDLNQVVDRIVASISRDTGLGNLDLPLFGAMRRFRGFEDVTGYVDQIFCRGFPFPQINCEVGIPIGLFQKALTDLREWFMSRPSSVHYPVILRSTGASSAWLSPSYERETCFFGFLISQTKDGSYPARSFEQLDEIQSILANSEGLPHWGKYFSPERYDFSGSLARWNDFQEVRRGRDPKSHFLSKFLETVFGLR